MALIESRDSNPEESSRHVAEMFDHLTVASKLLNERSETLPNGNLISDSVDPTVRNALARCVEGF